MVTFIHILQIIGIIILVLLGIVLALILLILFDPIRYKFLLNYDAYSDVGGKEDNYCFIKLKWILNLISCRIDIGLKGIQYDFRILGIKSNLLDKFVFGKSDNDKEKYEINEYLEERNDSKLYDEDLTKEDLKENSKDIDKVNDKVDETEKKSQEESTQLLDDIEEIWEDLVSDNEYEQEDEFSEEKGFKKIFKNIKHINFKNLTFRNFFKELKNVLLGFMHTIKGIIVAIFKSVKKLYEKYELIANLWNKKSTQIAFTRIKNYVSKLCKNILPKKKAICINIGFEDPAQTGVVLAVLGSLYGAIGDTFKVNPNFEDKECSINCKLIGKIRVLALGLIFIKIMRDKAIKRLVSNIEKLKEDLSNE